MVNRIVANKRLEGQMNVNIACSVPGCTWPVIGQCTGYKKTCQRFYCQEHSSDTLCADCAGRKTADEQTELIYQDYLATAKKVSQEFIPLSKYQIQHRQLIKPGVWCLVIGLFFLILTSVISSTPIPQSDVNIFNAFEILGILLISWPVLVFLLYSVDWVIWQNAEKQRKLTEKIDDIDKVKPGFKQFWIAWVKQRKEEQAEKNKKALLAVLTVAAVIAAGAAAAASSESDYERTRRAVRDELKK